MTEQNPLISVIVPVYNAELYLEECILSILRQSYQNLQIIVINDGSTDNSGEICDNFAKLDNRIEVFHIENKGSVYARKYGLEKAKGVFIGFVDADDYIEVNMYKQLVENILQTGADFVNSGFWEEKELKNETTCNISFTEKVIELEEDKDRIETIIQYVINAKKGREISNNLWNKLFRKELIKKNFLSLSDEQQYGEDLLCLCKCIIESKKISLCEAALYHYRIKEISLSHLANEKFFFEQIKLMACLIKEFEDKEYYEQVKENLFGYVTQKTISTLENVSKKKIRIPFFYIENTEFLYGKKIVIYGAGAVGQDYYLQLKKEKKCHIVQWVDSYSEKYSFDYAKIVKITDVNEDYDYIIIAVEEKMVADEIKEILYKYHIDKSKILWFSPSKYWHNN